MGCVTSSTAKEDGDAHGSNPSNPSAPQGAQGSNANSNGVDSELAKKQRRRLSVAPQHVGDITAAEAEAIRRASMASADPEALAILGTDSGSVDTVLAKLGLSHAFRTRKGVVPYNRNKVNQDRAVIRYVLTENREAAISNGPSNPANQEVALWGVMDGHGEFGHLVAGFVQEQLPLALARQNIPAAPESAILDAVKSVVDNLATTHINVSFSGTTCVFGVKVANSLYVANIGDSRCIMCRQNEEGAISAVALSYDQKPETPAEKARILAAGGRVEPLPGPPGEDCGPPRVWLAEVDVPGLAMSRSIGDEVSQTVGVISVPEIIKHDIQPNDIFGIWASDGVWEFLSNEQVVSIVWKYKDNLQQAAHELAEESAKQWKKEEEVIDDITCVIVKFNNPK